MDLIEIGELVLFAKEHYEPFRKMPDDIVSNYFTTYQDTIIVDRQGDEIRGFALYQEWPEFLNFIIICHVDDSAYTWMMKLIKKDLAGNTIAWFDEKKMEPRFIKCHR